MATKKETAVKEIGLVQFEKATIRVRIVGDSPLIMNAWSEKAKKELFDKYTKTPKKAAKEAKNPVAEFINSMYWMTPKPEEMTMEDDMGHYVVRRITPKECERLQGFPDDHTNIGKWVDKKGKTRETTDAARYKALGNSMAVPVMRFIAERIDWALANPITEDTAPKYDYQPEFF